MKKFHLDPEKYHCKHSNKIVSEIHPTSYGPLYIRLRVRFFVGFEKIGSVGFEWICGFGFGWVYLNPDLDFREKLSSEFDLDLSSLTRFGFDLDLLGWWICTPLVVFISLSIGQLTIWRGIAWYRQTTWTWVISVKGPSRIWDHLRGHPRVWMAKFCRI